ncbi:hypothetical protein SAMN05444392_1122 [Seinonella peptonophila]|uniref:Uncharacterized protein n=1 Tax=Seinonella peptonophila TaxID=112248 RepID=A0A1M5A421_9BACL|nr:hypothetical protein [Seinonella peptonophila]SHF25060.1 hypothetical protein SAMN05444392_1122 [Seinonella peptonophila]
MIEVDAFDTPLIKTSFSQFGFSLFAYRYLDNEVEQLDDEELEEWNRIAVDCLVTWFADQISKLDAHYPIPLYLHLHDYTQAYWIQERKWIDTANL